MADLYSRVADFIEDAGMLSGRTRAVVAVSGGADSLCMLDCLHHLELDFVVAHLDHQLRSDSSADAEYVRQVCHRYGIPFVLGRASIRSRTSQGGSVEETARRVRYQFLGEICLIRGIDTLAVGHTQDDQVETVLMHFLRGAGPEGLSGMAPVAPLGPWLGPGLGGLRLIRPLLAITHEQAKAHCLQMGLDPREDATNVDRRYLRNRIRYELLPVLESYNPRIRSTLGRLAKVMAGQCELTMAMVEGAWARVVSCPQANSIQIDRASLLKEFPAVQRELLRLAYQTLAGANVDMGFGGVERLLGWMRSDRRRELRLPGLLVARADGEAIILEHFLSVSQLTRWPQYGKGLVTNVDVPSTIALDHEWVLELSERSVGPEGRTETEIRVDPLAVAFDLDLLPGPLCLRTPVPGDRLHPYGMVGSTKLSDLFINRHIPRLARRNWPLLLAQDEILWVCGLRRSSHALVTPSTGRILFATLKRPQGAEPSAT